MKVPRKNVSSELHDVKWPKKEEEKPVIAPTPMTREAAKTSSVFWPATSFAVIILLIGGLFIFESRSLNLAEAEKENSTANLKGIWDRGVEAYRNLRVFSSNTFSLIDDMAKIQNLVPEALRGEKGEELIGTIRSAQRHIEALAIEAEALHRSGDEKFLILGGRNPLTIGSNLGQVNNFLKGFIPWLEEEKRVIVLFQNPSELRPAGGFLGSFAEVNISRGAVKDVRVYDINEIDRDLGLKLAPPEPLQALGSRWYTRDANWFFGFPESAQTVADFMESSGIFLKEDKKIDAVLSISGKVLEDILRVTGPLELEDGITVLDYENFLREIQEDIQDNRQVGEGEPKRILKEAMHIMMERLSELGGRERKEISNMTKEWMSEKDIMIFMRDKDLQGFLEYSGWSGSVYSLPRNFQGDYLAVVSSNMASGKSDIVIERNINLVSHIDLDGTVRNELTIKREHLGHRESSWWYKTPNESYFKIFVPRGSNLEALSGAFRKTGFQTTKLEKNDPVSKIEESAGKFLTVPEAGFMEEYGKKALGFWARLNPGETKELKVEYTNKLFLAPTPEQKYQFVFEKQSGTQGEYHFELIAPVGFIWKETNSPVYEYKTNDPPGRLILTLTLDEDF